VSRGPGEAALSFSGETPGRSDAFEARELPPAEFLDPESSVLLGVGATAPTVDPVGEQAGASAGGASAGRASWKRRIAPHHREAVQGFFGRGKD